MLFFFKHGGIMLETKKIARMIMMTLLFLIFTVNTLHASGSFRCGNGLVSVGDDSFIVLKKCGEPISKEVVGYTIKNNERELKIEIWIYGPKGGVYYHLKIEGGKIVEITNIRE